MVIYTTAKSKADLHGILHLQKTNLPDNLTKEEKASQGFVTVVHSFDDLQNMNAIEQHIIAKDGDKVVAYLLAMTAASKAGIPVLKPMFQTFDEIVYNGRLVSGYNYMVVGQVCVDKAYRGQGVLDACYATYKKQFDSTYNFAVTEIDTANVRSLAAHKRIGFEEVHRFTAPNGVEWSIVLWSW